MDEANIKRFFCKFSIFFSHFLNTILAAFHSGIFSSSKYLCAYFAAFLASENLSSSIYKIDYKSNDSALILQFSLF